MQKGYLLVLVLVFGSVFTVLLSGFLGYIISQSQVVNFRYEQQRASDIAEGGLNYYRWFLAHYPGDLTNGTGQPGPYILPYKDPEGSNIGEFSLSIASSTYCGELSAIDITSVGTSYADETAKATIQARYARPSVASYYSITNAPVYFNSVGVVTGPIHSNQGIRMEKAHNSTVSSGVPTWTCDSTFGCTPTITAAGVYSTGVLSNPALFNYPAAPIDFAGITIDLTDMQNKAQNSGGIYLPKTTKSGYHLIFKAGNIVEVRRVNSKANEPNGVAWGYYMNVINGSTLIGNYAINQSCPVIFAEDQVWVEGVINGKVSLAVADVDTAGHDPSIIINSNITYGSPNSGLLMVAEKDVLIGFTVPDNLVLNGIFVAQTGKFGRNYYDTKVPNAWEDYIIRNSLTINGSTVSFNRSGYNYSSGGGTLLSGFRNVTNTYDVNQVYNPPPYTPYTSDVYQFIQWRQEG